jgi:hypothetical protein
MRGRIRLPLRIVATVAAATIALAALRSDNRLQEIAGALLLVVLVGWMTVSLFRARKRLLK